MDPAALRPGNTLSGDSRLKFKIACPVGAAVKFSGAT